jgi:hypothetical protein
MGAPGRFRYTGSTRRWADQAGIFGGFRRRRGEIQVSFKFHHSLFVSTHSSNHAIRLELST